MLNLIRADFYKAIHGKVLKVCFLRDCEKKSVNKILL